MINNKLLVHLVAFMSIFLIDIYFNYLLMVISLGIILLSILVSIVRTP